MTRAKAKAKAAPAGKPAREARPKAGIVPPSPDVDLRTALRSRSGVRPRGAPLLLPDTMVLPGQGRDGLKGVVIYLNEAAKDQLARLSIDQRRTVQDLGVEAINLLFRRYRQKPIG